MATVDDVLRLAASLNPGTDYDVVCCNRSRRTPLIDDGRGNDNPPWRVLGDEGAPASAWLKKLFFSEPGGDIYASAATVTAALDLIAEDLRALLRAEAQRLARAAEVA